MCNYVCVLFKFYFKGKGGIAFAQDTMEGEEDEATVETETGTEDGGEDTDAVVTDKVSILQ